MLGIKTSCNSWAVWHHIFSLSAATRDGQTIISKHLNAWLVCLQRSIRGPYSQKMRMSYNSVLSITSKLCKEQLRGGLWYPMKQTACHRTCLSSAVWFMSGSCSEQSQSSEPRCCSLLVHPLGHVDSLDLFGEMSHSYRRLFLRAVKVYSLMSLITETSGAALVKTRRAPHLHNKYTCYRSWVIFIKTAGF